MINVCTTLGNNTGKSACEVRMKRPKYPLLSNYEFTAAELASSDALKAAIIRQMLLGNTVAGKAFLFPEMRVTDDNTGDPNVQSLADGYEEVLNEALPKYTLHSTVGVCQQQSMVAFNGWTGGIFPIDADRVFWYRKTATGGGKGFSTGNLYTDPPRPGSSAAIQVAKTRVTFGSIDEFKSDLGAVKIDFNIASLLNIVDVILTDVEDAFNSPSTSTNVFIIGGLVKCSGDNIYAAYKDSLNSVLRWRSYRLDTLASIPITSVAKNDALLGWTITINAASFAALPSGTKFAVDLVTPDQLSPAVTGIEGTKAVFTKI